MKKEERHRGRLIDHIGLVVRDLAASKAFYCAVFDTLKIPVGGSDERNFWADELFISAPDSAEVRGELTGRHHIAFQTQDRAMVDAFHRAALAHGGTDNGAPGERSYHPGYYAAFVLDPDGNNIEAVFHGQAAAGETAQKGGISAALRRSPLADADLDRTRTREEGRPVEF